MILKCLLTTTLIIDLTFLKIITPTYDDNKFFLHGIFLLNWVGNK
jgi:hypothetical protein